MTHPEQLQAPDRSGEETAARDDASLVTLFLKTTKIFTTAVSETLGAQGFSVDEWMVLNVIRFTDGGSMTDIARESACQGASLTRAVDKLVSASLVYREVSPSDRRKVVVFISDRGRERHRELERQLSAVNDRVLGLLGERGLSRVGVTSLMLALSGN